MVPMKPMPISKRSISLRIFTIGLFGAVLMWTIETCRPETQSSNIMMLHSLKDSVIQEIEEIKQEIVCSENFQETDEAKRVFRVQHLKYIYMYLSGKREIVMKKDTSLLGVISAEVDCPYRWNSDKEL